MPNDEEKIDLDRIENIFSEVAVNFLFLGGCLCQPLFAFLHKLTIDYSEKDDNFILDNHINVKYNQTNHYLK